MLKHGTRAARTHELRVDIHDERVAQPAGNPLGCALWDMRLLGMAYRHISSAEGGGRAPADRRPDRLRRSRLVIAEKVGASFRYPRRTTRGEPLDTWVLGAFAVYGAGVGEALPERHRATQSDRNRHKSSGVRGADLLRGRQGNPFLGRLSRNLAGPSRRCLQELRRQVQGLDQGSHQARHVKRKEGKLRWQQIFRARGSRSSPPTE